MAETQRQQTGQNFQANKQNVQSLITELQAMTSRQGSAFTCSGEQATDILLPALQAWQHNQQA